MWSAECRHWLCHEAHELGADGIVRTKGQGTKREDLQGLMTCCQGEENLNILRFCCPVKAANLRTSNLSLVARGVTLRFFTSTLAAICRVGFC